MLRYAAFISPLSNPIFKATFFVVGSNGIQFPDILKDIDSEGHELALHTWTHHPLTALTNEQIVAELMYNQAYVYAATGKIVETMRPPYVCSSFSV